MSAILYKDRVYGASGSGGGGASAVSDLTDVELTDLSDGQVLKWDGAEEKWVNEDESGGGGSAVHYDDTARIIGTYDGKTLYRKCVRIQNFNISISVGGGLYAGTFNINDYISNIDMLFIDSIHTRYIISGGAQRSIIFGEYQSPDVALYTNASRSNVDMYVVLEYTKSS